MNELIIIFSVCVMIPTLAKLMQLREECELYKKHIKFQKSSIDFWMNQVDQHWKIHNDLVQAIQESETKSVDKTQNPDIL